MDENKTLMVEIEQRFLQLSFQRQSTNRDDACYKFEIRGRGNSRGATVR